MSDPLPGCTRLASDPSRWRLLLVEDSADDAELVCLELEEVGIDADYHRVDDERALLDALPTFAPHLVLSDRNLPGFSGQRALELVRQHAPAARFVFLSGETDSSDGTDPAQRMPPPEPVADASLRKDALTQLPALLRRLLA